ncbi:DUF4352 domain-containing protein [Actinoplanes sp. CA-051413]|uniref:DUF4352 domain-containing protein n=1 Tax=Actinoplanes sp. CA-051413 TaxID=3239899 RepID=UPI003D96B6BA
MSYQPPPPPQYGQQPPVSGPPGQQPYGYAPQQPAKKRKKWPFIVGGIVLLMIVGCVGAFALLGAGANEVAKSLDEADQNQQGKNAVAGQMGKPAKDGKFEFTVTKMKCGVASVGPADFGEKAQGAFCLVDVSIKNVGTTAEVFNDSSQQATDAAGNVYSVDSGAAVYANEDSSTFLEQINPGNTVRGKLVFDVPEGTKLTSVVLHESMFTAGIKIPLK